LTGAFTTDHRGIFTLREADDRKLRTQEGGTCLVLLRFDEQIPGEFASARQRRRLRTMKLGDDVDAINPFLPYTRAFPVPLSVPEMGSFAENLHENAWSGPANWAMLLRRAGSSATP